MRGPLILIWDRLNAHRSRVTQAYLARCPQIRTVLLPAYAPDLSPGEYVCGNFKGGPLANFAPEDADELAHVALRHVRVIARQQRLPRGFVRASGVPLRLR